MVSWVDTCSQGILSLHFDLFGYNGVGGDSPGWYHINSATSYENLLTQVVTLINSDPSRATRFPSFDWNNYDSDGNGDVDTMIIFHTGAVAENPAIPHTEGLLNEGILDEQYADDNVIRLDPISSGTVWSDNGPEEVIVPRASFIPMTPAGGLPDGLFLYSNLRVIEHEFMHQMGLPDIR